VPAPDRMTAQDWEAWCDAAAAGDEPPDPGWDDEDGDPELAAGQRADWAAGFARGGLADAELDGAIAAWDRVEAHASARKDLAVAEFIRRRPEKGCEPGEPGGMPARWDEFAADELRVLLAESKAAAERMMGRALSLAVRLPGTTAAYRSGRLRHASQCDLEHNIPYDQGGRTCLCNGGPQCQR